MFRLSINDHIMIAHSLPDPFFGPAQHMHGATLAVEAHFETAELDSHGVVLDIGRAVRSSQRLSTRCGMPTSTSTPTSPGRSRRPRSSPPTSAPACVPHSPTGLTSASP